jgi:hypothetical protein
MKRVLERKARVGAAPCTGLLGGALDLGYELQSAHLYRQGRQALL